METALRRMGEMLESTVDVIGGWLAGEAPIELLEPASWPLLLWLLLGAFVILLLALSLRRRSRTPLEVRPPEILVTQAELVPESRTGRLGAGALTMTVTNLGRYPVQLLEAAGTTGGGGRAGVAEVVALVPPMAEIEVSARLPVGKLEDGVLDLYCYAAATRTKIWRHRAELTWEPWARRFKVSPLEQRIEPVRGLASSRRDVVRMDDVKRIEEEAARHAERTTRHTDPGVRRTDPGLWRTDPGVRRTDPGARRATERYTDPGVQRTDPGVRRTDPGARRAAERHTDPGTWRAAERHNDPGRSRSAPPIETRSAPSGRPGSLVALLGSSRTRPIELPPEHRGGGAGASARATRAVRTSTPESAGAAETPAAETGTSPADTRSPEARPSDAPASARPSEATVPGGGPLAPAPRGSKASSGPEPARLPRAKPAASPADPVPAAGGERAPRSSAEPSASSATSGASGAASGSRAPTAARPPAPAAAGAPAAASAPAAAGALAASGEPVTPATPAAPAAAAAARAAATDAATPAPSSTHTVPTRVERAAIQRTGEEGPSGPPPAAQTDVEGDSRQPAPLPAPDTQAAAASDGPAPMLPRPGRPSPIRPPAVPPPTAPTVAGRREGAADRRPTIAPGPAIRHASTTPAADAPRDVTPRPGSGRSLPGSASEPARPGPVRPLAPRSVNEADDPDEPRAPRRPRNVSLEFPDEF